MMLKLGHVPNGKHLIERNEGGQQRSVKQWKEKHKGSTSSSFSHFFLSPLQPLALQRI